MAERHLFGEEATAIFVKAVDRVMEKIDGEGGRYQAVCRGVLKILEDAKAVDTLGTGTDEEGTALEVGTEGRPEIIGGQLLPQERRHGRFDIAVVEGGKEVVGGLDGGEAFIRIERIALVHT